MHCLWTFPAALMRTLVSCHYALSTASPLSLFPRSRRSRSRRRQTEVTSDVTGRPQTSLADLRRHWPTSDVTGPTSDLSRVATIVAVALSLAAADRCVCSTAGTRRRAALKGHGTSNLASAADVGAGSTTRVFAYSFRFSSCRSREDVNSQVEIHRER